MKAISLYQPYATLMALGIKCIETRSWNTNYQGPLLIHAANKAVPFIDTILKDHIEDRLKMKIIDLPRGGIIGKVEVVGCLKITGLNTPSQPEFFYGDYTPGRFAWMCANAKTFKKIIPYRGRQRLFDVPDEALRVCRVCGCSEFNACDGGCYWIEEDLCSACEDNG